MLVVSESFFFMSETNLRTTHAQWCRAIHPFNCTRLTFDSITVNSGPIDSPNTGYKAKKK